MNRIIQTHMNSRSFLAALAAAFVIFVWQSISHMALPWFHDSLNKFENEAVMVEAFKANSKVDGIYTLPQAEMNDEAAMKQMETSVSVFVAVKLNGRSGFGASLVHQFIYNLLGALFVTFLLTKLSHSGTGCRVGVTVFFSLFAIVTAILPNWLWWAFSNTFTGFVVFDHLVGWTLAGFVLAKLVPKNDEAEPATDASPATD
jgi:hypothetical protein